MSYILDALRRAEAERERGEVPGVHAQQFPMLSSDSDETGRSRWLIAAVALLTLALAGALAWKFLGGEEAPRPGAQGSVSPTISPSAAAPPAIVIAAAPTTAAPAIAVQPYPVPASAAKETAAPAPARPAESRPVVRRAAPPAAPGALPTPPRAAPENRIYALAELPDEIRREMPKLAFGGASYSSDASSRMVILNGRVFHEGDKVANGLVLQQIKLKAAVLAYKGYRYEIGF